MVSRGPDGAGLWVSGDRRVALAHRRLAIIDLTERGQQPMPSADGRLHVTFNGEIYNYRELRQELEARGCRFQSDCDTEVLLHLYAERGVEMVHALKGMYAFGIWDAREQTLFLARDPFGIKPLYIADDGHSLRFASQVKALLKGGAVDTAPEPAGSVGFLIWGCVPEPYTLYRSIRSLPAGSTLTVSRSQRPRTTRFFDVADEFRRAEDGSAPAIANAGKSCVAPPGECAASPYRDVPVGIFLSAGIDSTTIAGLAAEHGHAALRASRSASPNSTARRTRSAAGGTGSGTIRIAHEEHRITAADFNRAPAHSRGDGSTVVDGVNTHSSPRGRAVRAEGRALGRRWGRAVRRLSKLRAGAQDGALAQFHGRASARGPPSRWLAAPCARADLSWATQACWSMGQLWRRVSAPPGAVHAVGKRGRS